jgi:hypothetical protein
MSPFWYLASVPLSSCCVPVPGWSIMFWVVPSLFQLNFNSDALLCLTIVIPHTHARTHARTHTHHSQGYQIFWQVVGLERGPLSLVSRIEELHGRNSSGSGLESREYGRGYPLRWPRYALYPQKLALTLPTSGGRLIGIVFLRTKATKFLYTHITHE